VQYPLAYEAVAQVEGDTARPFLTSERQDAAVLQGREEISRTISNSISILNLKNSINLFQF